MKLALMEIEKHLCKRMSELLSPISARQDEHSKRIGRIEMDILKLNQIAQVISDISHKVNGNDVPGLDEIARSNRKDIDRHEEGIRKLMQFSETLQPVLVFYRVSIWIGSAVGLSVIALIWGILTHRIEITVP